MKKIEALVIGGREAAGRGEWEKALSEYESAFSLAGRSGSPADVANIARHIGVAYHQQGDVEAARDAYEVSLTVAVLNELAQEKAASLVCIANVEQHFGRLTEAELLYSEAQAIVEKTNDSSLAAKIELNLGVLANIRGDVDGALRRYRSALARHRQLGEEALVLGGLNNIGMAYVDLGRWNTAARFFDDAEVLAARLGDERMIASVATNRTEMYLRSGAYDEAREECARALDLFRRLDSASGTAEAYKLYGILYRETGRPDLADEHFDHAVALARRSGDKLLVAESLSEWARVHGNDDRNREALECLNEAYRIFSQMRAARELLDVEKRLDGVEASYLDVVRAWAESIESKDRYTAGHCERVANYACMLAERTGFLGRELTWLRMGGFLHDVGKIVVPPEVLNKPGKLTPEEWAVMQSHTTEGHRIVSELSFPWDIGPIVRSHHERWDGSGYPDGLRGEEIPFTARILCLADVYDALTTTRSYRGAMGREEALAIMEADAGRIFDPRLYPLFASLVRQQEPSLDRRFPAFSNVSVAAA